MSDDAPPEPISYEQAYAQCRLDSDDEKDLVEGLIIAARGYVEDYTGLVLTPRTVVETARSLDRWIDLAAWPVQDVTEVSYTDAIGAVQTLDLSTLIVSRERRPVRIRPQAVGWGVSGSWCGGSPGPVVITLEAGFAAPEDVPATVKQAMLLLVGHWYSNRAAAEVGASAAATEVPFAVEALLRRWRLVTI